MLTLDIDVCDADERLYRSALSKLGHLEMEKQIALVGASVVYADRPRCWIIDDVKEYASFEDYLND